MRASEFLTKTEIVNLNPTKVSHWVARSKEKYFDSHRYRYPSPKILTDFTIRSYGKFFPFIKFKEKDNYCDSVAPFLVTNNCISKSTDL